jgi:hypothetical protein
MWGPYTYLTAAQSRPWGRSVRKLQNVRYYWKSFPNIRPESDVGDCLMHLPSLFLIDENGERVPHAGAYISFKHVICDFTVPLPLYGNLLQIKICY